MKPRSLILILTIACLSILAMVAGLASVVKSGLAAGAVTYLVLDTAVASLAAQVFGLPTGRLFVTTNSLGTLAETGVFHDALGLLLKRLPFVKRMAGDFGATMGWQGMPFNVQQILKNYNVSHTVSDRSTTGTYAKQAGVNAGTDGTFTLTQWPYVSFGFTLVELNQMIDSATNADARQMVVQKLMTKAFNTLGTSIANRYLGMFTAANFPDPASVVMAAATADYKKLGSAVDVLLTADALGMQAPDAILGITPFRNVVNSLTAIANSSYNVNEIITEGVTSEAVSGAASISRYNLTLPSDAPNGVLADPQALVMANRVPTEEMLPNDPVYTEIVTDPGTGFSILLREAKDPMTGEVTRTITTLYDFAVGLKQHAVRIKES